MFSWDCSDPQLLTAESLQEVFGSDFENASVGSTKYYYFHELIFPVQLPVCMTTSNLAQTKVCNFTFAYVNSNDYISRN